MSYAEFPENRIWHNMQIVSRDNLHKMQKTVFWKKNEKKIFQIVACWNFTQSAKR